MNYNVSNIIDKGINFLYDSQSSGGPFPESIFILKENNWKKTLPTIFSTALISNSINSILKYEDYLSAESALKCKEMRKKTFVFFTNEMKLPGIWKFGSCDDLKWKNLPFDLDDTCCISYLLKDYHPYIHFGMNKNLIKKNQNEEGLFYTWILPPSLKNQNDIDSIVNVNTISYLGENPFTKKAIEHICRLINNDNENGSFYYYLDVNTLYYFISRAYSSGILSFSQCKDSIIEKIKMKDILGNDILDAANIITLINLGFTKKDFLIRKLDFILNSVNEIGNWNKKPFYQGEEYPKPISLYWGSESITTAICLEAIVMLKAIGYLT